MKRIPFAKVRQAVLEKEIKILDDLIEIVTKKEAKELEKEKKSLIKKMQKVDNLLDLIDLLEDNGYEQHDTFHCIYSAVCEYYDPKKRK